MLYSAVSQPRPEPRSQRGTPSLSEAVHNTIVSPSAMRADPAANLATAGSMLSGRSLRSIVDLGIVGERTIAVDCDVLQADGGTRTAGITGAYVAVYQVALKIKDLLGLGELPLFDSLSAISVGVVDGRTLLDLDYEEDSAAAVDMNVVMTGEGKLVEVQATAEGEPYARETLDEMLELAAAGAAALAAAQAAAVEELG